MSTTTWSLVALTVAAAAFAPFQSDSLKRHELAQCEVEIRDNDEPEVTVYASESSSGDVTFTLITPIESIRVSDADRTVDSTTGDVKEVPSLAYKKITANFTYDSSSETYDLEVSNGVETFSFANVATGAYYALGPFDYGVQEVRGPDGSVGDPEKARTALVWFENHGLKAGFTITDIGSGS